MKLIDVILLGLACWRLSSLFYQEEGPFGMFTKIREKIGIQHDVNGVPCIYPDKFWCKLFSCMWCLSVWFAGMLTVGYIFLPTITIYFALWLSLSTITIMVNEWLVAGKE